MPSQPGDLGPPTSPQGFHDRFLSGEAARVALVFSLVFSLAVLNLFFREDAIPQPQAGFRVLQRALDPRHLNQIYPDTYNHSPKLALRLGWCQRLAPNFLGACRPVNLRSVEMKDLLT